MHVLGSAGQVETAVDPADRLAIVQQADLVFGVSVEQVCVCVCACVRACVCVCVCVCCSLVLASQPTRHTGGLVSQCPPPPRLGLAIKTRSSGHVRRPGQLCGQ